MPIPMNVPDLIYQTGKLAYNKGANAVARSDMDEEFRNRGAVDAQQVPADHPSDPYQLQGWTGEQQSNLPTGNTPPVQEVGVLSTPPTVEAPSPDPIENPAASVAVSSARQAGSLPKRIPQPPTMAQTATQVLDQEADQVLFQQVTHPNWYEDDSFYEGMLSFGLNLLSGNNWAASFNAGSKVFMDSKGLEERQIWANDLLAKGYDAMDVQAWVKSGDNKMLKDPMEKKMKQQQYALGQYQLQDAAYKSSPEYQAYLRDKDTFGMEMQLEGLDLQRESQANSQALGWANLEQRQKEHADDRADKKAAADAKAAAAADGDKVAARDTVMLINQMSADLDVANRPVDTIGGIGASVARGVLGEDTGSVILNSPEAADYTPNAAEANKTRVAQNQFVEGAIRLATGAVVKPSEQAMYREFLFPQGAEFRNPEVVARKKAAQQMLNVVGRQIGMGQGKKWDSATTLKAVRDVSSGAAQLVSRDGMPVGLRYSTGQVVVF